MNLGYKPNIIFELSRNLKKNRNRKEKIAFSKKYVSKLDKGQKNPCLKDQT